MNLLLYEPKTACLDTPCASTHISEQGLCDQSWWACVCMYICNLANRGSKLQCDGLLKENVRCDIKTYCHKCWGALTIGLKFWGVHSTCAPVLTSL